jgi:hypothetical protein
VSKTLPEETERATVFPRNPRPKKRYQRESTVEDYLREQVERQSGLCEKHVSPGQRGVPDRLVTWYWGEMDFVETKSPGKGAEDHQTRDHKRRAARRVPVYLIDTRDKVDEYIRARVVGRRAPEHLFSVPLPT